MIWQNGIQEVRSWYDKRKKREYKSFFFFEKFNLKPTLICVGSHPHQCLLVLASVFRKITSGGQNEASFGRSKATSLPTSHNTITILVDIYYTLLRLFCAVLCFGSPNSGLCASAEAQLSGLQLAFGLSYADIYTSEVLRREPL